MTTTTSSSSSTFDEDLLPPPLLPIKPPPPPQLALLKDNHDTAASEMCESDSGCSGLPPSPGGGGGHLHALWAKVRALGIMSGNADLFKRRLPQHATKAREGQWAGGGPAFPVTPAAAAPSLLFSAPPPTALDILSLQHNPIVLAIRAYQFELLQKQVLTLFTDH